MEKQKKAPPQSMGLPYVLLFAGGYVMALGTMVPFMAIIAIALYGAGLYLRKQPVSVQNGLPDIGTQIEQVRRLLHAAAARLTPPERSQLPTDAPMRPRPAARPGPLVWQDCPADGERICIDGLCANFTQADILQLYEELGHMGKTSAGYALGLRHQIVEFSHIPEGARVENMALLRNMQVTCDAIRCERFILRTSRGVSHLRGLLIHPKASDPMCLAVIFLQKAGHGVLHVFTLLMPTKQMEKYEAIRIASNSSAELRRAEADVTRQAGAAVRTLLHL